MKRKLYKEFTLTEIARAAELFGVTDGERKIRAVTTDSRECEEGDLFFALRGENADGADYIPEAIARGAVAVCDKETPGALLCDSTTAALLRLGAFVRHTLPGLQATVAITGSVGKTTTKEFSRALIGQKYRVHATEGNENNELGVALTLCGAPEDTEVLIVEAGMNRRGEISRLSKVIAPDFAIITGIGSAHIGNLGSREMIAEEKASIRDGMENGPVAVPKEERLLADIPGRITVSITDPLADVFLLPLKESAAGTEFDLFLSGDGIGCGFCSIAGEARLSDLAFAIAAARFVGIDGSNIIEYISKIKCDILRQKIIPCGEFKIIDDTYSSSPEAVLSSLSLLRLGRGIPFSVLLGDMLELGCETERLHRSVGRAVAKAGARRLYTYGVYGRFFAEGARDGGMPPSAISSNSDTTSPEESAAQIVAHRLPGEIVLCKGSHALHMERVVDEIIRLTGGES